VEAGGIEFLCRMSNRLRKDLVFPTADASSGGRQGVVDVREARVVDPVAVGDQVLFVDAGGGTGAIRGILPRRNKFSRLATKGRPIEQIIAANIDQVVAVFAAARPDPRRDMLDRMAVESELLGIPLRIVFTKMDLADDDMIAEMATLYDAIGYPVHLTCALQGLGIDGLAAVLRDRVSALVGESGVGKTTLLNTIQPGLGRRVGDVKNDRRGRGRHTTTMLEMIDLEMGGSLVDTPGINSMKLYNPDPLDQDPAHCFPEMRPFVGNCKFGRNCSHVHEPGCAIIEAVEAGKIDALRHISYCEMRDELLIPSTPRGAAGG
jgi:ribosome biogenesis GTPase